MSQRIVALSLFLLRTMVFSLMGLLYAVFSLGFWYLFFPPSQGTPDADNYILIIGAWGAVLSFLTVLSMTGFANKASSYPILVRLPSRVEYVTAVLLSSLAYSLLLQLLVAFLALWEGPKMTFLQAADIPPIWLAVNILAGVLALHASDFITAGWSRTYVFGVLAIFILGSGLNAETGFWLSDRVHAVAEFMINHSYPAIGNGFHNWANWFSATGVDWLSGFFGILFWPIRAIAEAVITGYFSPVQALAPAVLLLYATILFMLAADFFATKDVEFLE